MPKSWSFLASIAILTDGILAGSGIRGPAAAARGLTIPPRPLHLVPPPDVPDRPWIHVVATRGLGGLIHAVLYLVCGALHVVDPAEAVVGVADGGLHTIGNVQGEP